MSAITIHTYLPDTNESAEVRTKKLELTKKLITNYLFEDGREVVLHPLVGSVRDRDNSTNRASSDFTLPNNAIILHSDPTNDPTQPSIPNPTPATTTSYLVKRKIFKPAPIILNASKALDTKRRRASDVSSTEGVNRDDLVSSPESRVPVIKIVPNSNGKDRAISEEEEERDGERDEEMGDIVIRGYEDEMGTLLAIPNTSATSAGVAIRKKDGKAIDPGKDAMKRCIPRPYSLPYSEIGNINPETQHLSPVLHSFLDPISSLPVSLSRNPQFPLAFSNLSLGRRGSWIIPITTSNKFPSKVLHESISKPTWNKRIGNCSIPSKVYIYWTEDRLKALWDIIRNLNISGNMGSVYASCNFSDDFKTSSTSTTTSSSISTTKKNEGLSNYFQSVDHIRISVDAHLAIPLRTLLGLTDARKSKSTGGTGEKFKDVEKFLKNAGLVWINESGEFILVA